jgi:hypothetical protein
MVLIPGDAGPFCLCGEKPGAIAPTQASKQAEPRELLHTRQYCERLKHSRGLSRT